MPRLRNHAIGSSCLRVEHSLSCKLPAPCLCAHVLTCVRVLAAIRVLCVCFFPFLTLMLCVVINFVRVRGSNLWRFLTNGKTTTTIRKKPWYSSGSLDHSRGVECNPHPLGRHNVEVYTFLFPVRSKAYRYRILNFHSVRFYQAVIGLSLIHI